VPQGAIAHFALFLLRHSAVGGILRPSDAPRPFRGTHTTSKLSGPKCRAGGCAWRSPPLQWAPSAPGKGRVMTALVSGRRGPNRPPEFGVSYLANIVVWGPTPKQPGYLQ